jgi:hypothetical protein
LVIEDWIDYHHYSQIIVLETCGATVGIHIIAPLS